MNLVYISNNSNSVDGGPNWSVPYSVKAQQKYDNVLWINLSVGTFQRHWGEVEAYHNISDYGRRISLKLLPAPFCNPDFVVFEGFYFFEHVRFAKELKKNNVPYIIVPRGSLTKNAFHNGSIIKFIKKKLAHLLFFNSYIYNAKCIQYLTLTERSESDKVLCVPSFILPNGINLPSKIKDNFSKGIKGVFIGRQDINQKGLDILFAAIEKLKKELRKASFTLDIYGPPRYDYKRVTELINEMGIHDIVRNHEVGISGEDKENVLLSSDVFFLTSRFEGHPMGLIEALSYGVPVLITQGANMRENVDNYYAGWTCDTTIEGVTKALEHMLADKNNFQEIGSNARRLASMYDWDLLAQQFHNILMQQMH